MLIHKRNRPIIDVILLVLIHKRNRPIIDVILLSNAEAYIHVRGALVVRLAPPMKGGYW